MPRTRFLLLFSLFIFLLSVFHLDLWSNANTSSRIALVKSIVDDYSLKVDKYHEESIDFAYVNNHYYSEKAPLPSLIVIPFYSLFRIFGFEKSHILVQVLGDILAGSIPFALLIMLLFFSIKNQDNAVLKSALPVFGSFIFIYSGTFFAHTLTALLILAAYISLKKEKLLLAGILSGFAILCEYPVFVICFLWMISIWYNQKLRSALNFILGLLPAFILILFYNYLTTGKAFDFLYSHQLNFKGNSQNVGFTGPTLNGIFELSMGFYRGLLFYAPVLIISFLVLFKLKPLKETISGYLFLPCIFYFLLIASNRGWYGGWCYGPRYLTCIAALLLYAIITKISPQSKRINFFFYFLSVVGLIMAFMDKSTVLYSLPTEDHNPVFNIVIPNFFAGHFNENNLASLLFGLSPITGNLVWLFVMVLGLFYFNKWHNTLLKSEKIR